MDTKKHRGDANNKKPQARTGSQQREMQVAPREGARNHDVSHGMLGPDGKLVASGAPVLADLLAKIKR